MKSDDADVVEDEATEREIRRIRQKRGRQMSETITTETHALNCDSRLGYQCTCVPRPEPDTSGEWRIDYSLKGGYCINDETGCIAHVLRDEAVANQILREHRSHLVLISALQFAVTVLQQQNLAGSIYAPVLQQARAALALVKGRE